MTHQAKIEPTPEVLAANKRFHAAAVSDRKRLKLASVSEPGDWQEKQAPTEKVMVQITGTRLRQQGRRRKMDARLIEAIGPERERAMDEICAARRILTEGMGGLVMRYDQEVRGGAAASSESADDYRQRLIRQYTDWGRACAVNGIHRSAVMQIISDGHSPSAVDKGLRKGNGWAKDNLIAGLDLYCRLNRIG